MLKIMVKKSLNSLKIRQRACELYLKDRPVDDILRIIKDEFNEIIRRNTLMSWKRRDNWDGIKQYAFSASLAQMGTQRSIRLLEESEKHRESYQKLSNKAQNELEGLTFDSAMDAARGLQICIEGERKIINAMVNFQFAEDIFNIIVNYIGDLEVRRKIGLEIQKKLVEYSEY